jgi:hypothetical protein
VGNLPKTVEEIDRVLKPGGKVLVLEHVVSEKGWMATIQRAITPIWRHLADGCHLDRDIDRELQIFFGLREQHRFLIQNTPFIYGVYEKIRKPET